MKPVTATIEPLAAGAVREPLCAVGVTGAAAF